MSARVVQHPSSGQPDDLGFREADAIIAQRGIVTAVRIAGLIFVRAATTEARFDRRPVPDVLAHLLIGLYERSEQAHRLLAHFKENPSMFRRIEAEGRKANR